jgi:hypothetical protein
VNRDRAVELASKVLAGGLFVVSVAGLAVSLTSGEDLATALFSVYLTGLLVVGVFRDVTDERNWQLAFFGGVALWGGYEYLTVGDLFSLLLAVVGIVMVAANLRNLG